MKEIQTEESLANFMRSLFNESDRGCVILIAAFLDDLLGRLHRSKMSSASHPSEKLLKQLLKGHGPLATFSARIQLAYTYGFITAEAYRDLERLRAMRNDAAHVGEPFDFSDSGLRAKVFALSLSERAREIEPTIQMSPEEAKAIDTPMDTPPGARMHLLLTGTFLGLSILRDAWSELKAQVERTAEESTANSPTPS